MRRVLLAAPRGYCAGVERAIITVEEALRRFGPPVYVRKQIVHNLHVVRDLEARGAVFVDEETEVPEGETVVFSAHGVAPSVHANAEARRLSTIVSPAEPWPGRIPAMTSGCAPRPVLLYMGLFSRFWVQGRQMHRP